MARRRSGDIRRRWELRVLVALPAVWILFAAVGGFTAIQLTLGALGQSSSPAVDRVLILVISVGSLLALACGVALAIAVTHPMRDLMRKIQHRLHGDAAVSLAAGNEMRQLSNAFDNMLLSFDKFVSDTHIVDGMPLGIIVVDRDNRIVRANPEAQRHAGSERGALPGRRLDEICAPAMRDRLREALASVRETGTSAELSGDLFGQADGLQAPHALTLHPTTIVGEVVVVVRDVAQLATIRGQMQRVDQLAALGAHVASLAHEIGGGLMGIQMLIEAIEPRTPAEMKLHEKLRDEVERASRLLTEIRTFGQASARERVATNLARTVDEILWMLEPRFEAKQLRVERRLEATLPPAMIDRDRIVQAIINILTNAFEATPPQGTVTVAVEGRDGATLIRVANTGSYIPPEERERIFTLFYTTKKGGSGFGLAQARRALVDHGGDIEIESSRERGTEFVLRFPAGTSGHSADRQPLTGEPLRQSAF